MLWFIEVLCLRKWHHPQLRKILAQKLCDLKNCCKNILYQPNKILTPGCVLKTTELNKNIPVVIDKSTFFIWGKKGESMNKFFSVYYVTCYIWDFLHADFFPLSCILFSISHPHFLISTTYFIPYFLCVIYYCWND